MGAKLGVCWFTGI